MTMPRQHLGTPSPYGTTSVVDGRYQRPSAPIRSGVPAGFGSGVFEVA